MTQKWNNNGNSVVDQQGTFGDFFKIWEEQQGELAYQLVSISSKFASWLIMNEPDTFGLVPLSVGQTSP